MPKKGIRKLKLRLNGGYYKLNKEPHIPGRNYKIQLDEGTIGLDDIAEMFHCNRTKIVVLFYNTGIIKPMGRKANKIIFDKQEVVRILSQYVNGHGQLQKFKAAKKV